ncbi:chymotrypsin-1-like [Stegodyphus dumicola]|uniref:chymotrypsin-1-like n=1 Tax=Stegodyphus dumicola TaxID=202533 RepID=UPI0015A791EE|nr:chymotrypsin-1-like [Stegodyphus dumicola]
MRAKGETQLQSSKMKPVNTEDDMKVGVGTPDDETQATRGFPLIVGGRNAKQGMFPWMVALYYKDEIICAGAIVSNTSILTAAHCIIMEGVLQWTTSFYGIIGDVNRHLGRRIFFNSFTPHPNYDHFDNDLALLTTQGTIIFNELVKPICVARPDTDDMEYLNTTSMGWGSTSRIRWGKKIPDILQYVKLNVAANDQCSFLFPRLSENQLCAGRRLSGICYGDSGGPLVHLSANNPPVAIGIAAYVNELVGCAKFTGLAVFTRLSNYYEFITENNAGSKICTV